MSTRPRRPGPTVRVRVDELRADVDDRHHEDRLATEEPLEVRLAWPGEPARRVWVTMRTPGHDFELAAGWVVHEGLAAPADLHTVVYCTDRDLTPEQEFNVVTVTLDQPPARDPGHRHTAQSAGSSACGVCGKDSLEEALAVVAATRWTGALPAARRRTTAARRAARRSSRSSTAPAACTPPACSPPTASCSSCARTSGGTTPSTRSPAPACSAGHSPAAACLVVSGRAGFELVQKAAAAGVGALVAVGAPTSLSSTWPDAAASPCTGSPGPDAPSATPPGATPT